MADDKYVRLAAAHCKKCGVAFSKKCTAVYCSRKCGRRDWLDRNPAKANEYADRARLVPTLKRVCAVFFNTCRVCGKCWTAQKNALICSSECFKAEARAKALRYAIDQHRKAGKAVDCVECHARFCPLYGCKHGSLPLCSPCADMRRARQRQIERRETGNHIRRAKHYGVAYKRFKLSSVLERDGWLCQLCGIATPKELRGLYVANAPEVDHIIPVSKGGPHLPSNCQCLCRACNLLKSDTYPIGGEISTNWQTGNRARSHAKVF